jgi:hypothetical protein
MPVEYLSVEGTADADTIHTLNERAVEGWRIAHIIPTVNKFPHYLWVMERDTTTAVHGTAGHDPGTCTTCDAARRMLDEHQRAIQTRALLQGIQSRRADPAPAGGS